MKKFLVSLLTLMLAICTAFAVACGAPEEEGAQEGGQTSYEITESQFNSAFSIYDAPFQVVATEGELGGEVYIAEVNYVPGKIYEKETEGTDVDEIYYSKDGNNYYKYVKEDGNWIKLDADSYVNVLEFYNPLVFVAEELELNLSFSDLTFNKETNRYDYVKDYGMGISLDLTFKFENARIVYFGVRLGNNVEAEILTMSFTYDNVAVTLPQIGGGSQGGESGGNEGNQSAYEVTENQFLEATNSANYNVFMVDGENVIKENGVINPNASSIVKYVFVENGFYTKTPSQEVYFQKSGSEYFAYIQGESEWQKVTVPQTLYEDNRAKVLSNATPAFMINNYGIVYTALTFNDTENCYVYSPAGENGMSATIKIFFEDGKIVKFYMNAVNVIEQEEVTITMVYTYDNVTISYPNVGGGSQGGESGGESGGDATCQHVWEEISLNNGIMTYKCSKCQEDKTEDVTEFYQSVTNNIANTIFGLADGGTETPSRFSVSLFSDYNWMDADWSVHGMNVKGVVMFVKMLADMMDNPNFNVTDAPVFFEYSYPAQGETGRAILLYDFDVANDKVTMHWDVESYINGNTTNIYLYIDVAYDFDNDSLVAFNLASSQSRGVASYTFGYDYHDGNLRFTNDGNYIIEVMDFKGELDAVIENVIYLEADFTEEYSSMMDAMNPNQGGGNGGGNQGGDEGGEDPTDPNPNPGETPVDPNPGETPVDPNPGEKPVDPNPGETPEQQDAYVFKFKSIVILGKECFVGDTSNGLSITEDFATFVLNKDYTAQMVNSEMTCNGTWQVFGDVIMVELTDNEDTYSFVLKYDNDANVVTFKVENYTYKFDVPQNVAYDELIGEVDMMYASLEKIVVGENEFTIGSQVGDILLQPESAYMKIFIDGKFMFHTVMGYEAYGYWTLSEIEDTIILSYVFDEDDYVSKAVTLNNGATICLDLSDFDGLTYYLNVDGIGGDEMPPEDATDIYGVYNFVKVVVNVGGQDMTLLPGQSLGTTEITSDFHVVEILPDGTYIIYGAQHGREITGTYEYVDGELIFDIESNSNASQTINVYFEDGVLVMVNASAQATITYYNSKDGQDIGGGDTPEGIRFTVTEEEFNKIIGLKDNRLALENTLFTFGEDYSEMMYNVILIQGDNVLCVQALEYGICWIYYVKTGEDYVIYNSLDFVEWFAIPVDSEQANAMYMQLMIASTPYGAIDLLGLTFADFTYNPDELLYEYANEQLVLRLGFINGSVMYINAEYSQNIEGSLYGQEYDSWIINKYEDVIFPDVIEGVPQGGFAGSLGEDIENGLFDDIGNNGGVVSPENPNRAEVFHVQSITINGKTYYVGDMVDEEFKLEREFAIFKTYNSIDSFYMLVDGVEYKGTFENLELGVTRLHFENQFGETGTIDVYTDEEEYKFTLTIQDMVIVFEYSHFEGGNTGGEDWKEPATYMEHFTTKSVTINGITYYEGDLMPSGRMVDESFATFEYFDNYTFFLNVDGYIYSGDLEYNSSSSANLIFINENGQKETLVFLFISEDPYEVSITVKGYEIIFQFAYDQELGGGEPPYDDAEWGKTFFVSSVNYNGVDYFLGEELPNGDILNEQWAVFELYGNYRFYLTVYGADYLHIEGEWSEYSDAQIKLSYIDMDGDQCSIYIDVNNDGTIGIAIKSYFITFKLAYGGGDFGDNEVNPEKPDVELPSTLRIGISPDYEPFAYYENGKVMGFDIELAYAIADLLGYAREDVELITVDLFDQLFLNLEKGEYDIVISGIPSTPEREERFNVSISYVEYFVCYEGDNGQNVEEFEEYHVFSYNNYELIEVINWSIQILLQNGYIDYLVAYWL